MRLKIVALFVCLYATMPCERAAAQCPGCYNNQTSMVGHGPAPDGFRPTDDKHLHRQYLGFKSGCNKCDRVERGQCCRQ
jgi:hypothetical protein